MRCTRLEPYQYLRYLLEQLVHLKDEEEIAKLAPHRINPDLLQQTAACAEARGACTRGKIDAYVGSALEI